MKKLIIFDWDDVIILGAKKGYYCCYEETLNELGVNLSEEEMDIRIKRKWGQPYKEELRELVKEKPEMLDEACRIYFEKKYLGETFVNELSEVVGVNELLIRLKAKYLLAVASANQREMILKKIMPKFNIPNVFCQIVTVHDDVLEGRSKPDPFMLQLILEKQVVAGNDTVYVGDAENDVLMARNAGVEPVVVLTGHLNKEEATGLGVKYVIPDVTQIESVLDKL